MLYDHLYLFCEQEVGEDVCYPCLLCTPVLGNARLKVAKLAPVLTILRAAPFSFLLSLPILQVWGRSNPQGSVVSHPHPQPFLLLLHSLQQSARAMSHIDCALSNVGEFLAAKCALVARFALFFVGYGSSDVPAST